MKNIFIILAISIFSTSCNNDKLQEYEVYQIVENMPRFPGCEDLPFNERRDCSNKKMLDFIYTRIKYPQEARENGIEGTVLIRFIIERNGKLSNKEIIKDIGGGCGQEVLRVINEMPKWVPGSIRDEEVRVYYNLPVKFRL